MLCVLGSWNLKYRSWPQCTLPRWLPSPDPTPAIPHSSHHLPPCNTAQLRREQRRRVAWTAAEEAVLDSFRQDPAGYPAGPLDARHYERGAGATCGCRAADRVA